MAEFQSTALELLLYPKAQLWDSYLTIMYPKAQLWDSSYWIIMCGIIGYFGGAGNHLTRILTGMSAIIYRAPDSTGVGIFGDDLDPIRARKSLGSVANLSKSLLNTPAYPNQAEQLLSLWTPAQATISPDKRQRRLLEFEGFPLPTKRKKPYPSFDDLIKSDTKKPLMLPPGTPGRPDPLPRFFIRSRRELKQLIQKLTIEYDLSFVVIQSLIRESLSKTLLKKNLEIETSDILAAFDQLFEKVFLEEKAKPIRGDSVKAQQHPYIQKYLLQYLKQSPIQIPEDYDRDGVRSLFRMLDAALLCRLPLNPALHVTLQRILKSICYPHSHLAEIEWRTLYRAEKGVNLYGWAAATALTYLQKMELFPLLWKDAKKKQGFTRAIIPGHTDPISLRFFSQPIISQGRWALQSSVTLQNAHPFFDAHQHRAIVLNGQFNVKIESEVREFLKQVGADTFRSENSSEYFSLLWGYYFENLNSEKKRYKAIRRQIDAGLEAYNIGSQAIDYHIYQRIKDKRTEQLDELAFLEAVRRMKQGGGQIATAGISLYSPRRMYVASHNRPAFVVHCINTNDFMLVSDVNAAMGLFPQKLIHKKRLELNTLRKHRTHTLTHLRATDSKTAISELEKEYQAKENEILECFRVTVFPLEGEEIFARIETEFKKGKIQRKLTISDFDGNPLPEIESFSTVLNPLQIQKELYGSFYEKHLHEIPERLNHILRFYLPETENAPQFNLRERVFHRRFGERFAGMKRIFLVGMGSAYHVGLMAKSFFQSFMPDIEVIAVQPIEIEDISKTIIPEKDLVILLSWSSTTADMVQFATGLKAHQAVMIGITEKVFADMALITAKSGGVIPVLSGEEVTISGIKSTLCMLFVVDILGMWLSSKRSQNLSDEADNDLIQNLRQLPSLISQVFEDEAIKSFSQSLAKESEQTCAALIFGDLCSIGTCREIALKLEENSWTSIGKPLDYRDIGNWKLEIGNWNSDTQENISRSPVLTMVNATNSERFQEALCVMKKLYIADIPFAAISYEHPDQNEITFYSQEHQLSLPKVADALQPFIDLPFYYQFALHYAQAQGRQADEFPRNRVKSVTAGRSRPKKQLTPAAELRSLKLETGNLKFETGNWKFETGNWKFETGNSEPPTNPPNFEFQISSFEFQISNWERASSHNWEKIYYRQISRLGHILCEENPLITLLKSAPENLTEILSKLATVIFENLPQSGEIIFIPYDRSSEAAARNLTVQWSRFLKCPIRVLFPEASFSRFPEDALLIFLSSKPVQNEKFLIPNSQFLIPNSCIWFGPELSETIAEHFKTSLGYFVIREEEAAFIESDLLYAGISALLINIWREKSSEQADILANHFRQAGCVIQNILNNISLKKSLLEAMKANQAYQTAFFIGPPGGSGLIWGDIFDRTGSLALQSHKFGESAHGPLVTVDDQIEKKFVALEKKEQMVLRYGESQIETWEQQYLSGESIDLFLEKESAKVSDFQPEVHKKEELSDTSPNFPSPFFAEGDWYLPVLQDSYDTTQDNLIIMDAASNHYFAQALDELSTYGCRYARMILITQESFSHDPEKKGLSQYPVSHLIHLPSLISEEEKAMPISDMLLPFAMNLVSMGMASAAAEVRGISFQPVSEESLLQKAFGDIGKVMVRHGIEIKYMNHYLIESIKNIAPLIAEVDGIARYKVKSVENKEMLHQIASENLLLTPEETLTNFTQYELFGSEKSSFFLLSPDKEGFEGKAREDAEQTFQDKDWELWSEPFGNTWKVLTYRILGIQESVDKKPMVMIPLIDPLSREGTLFYLYVRYMEWDHTLLFEKQLPMTVKALGKEMRVHEYISPRYLKIVSRFNDIMAQQGHTWDDRLLGLIQRSLLFQKPSKEIATLLADRTLQILGTKQSAESKPMSIEAIGDAIEKSWLLFEQEDAQSDEARWKGLRERLTRFLTL